MFWKSMFASILHNFSSLIWSEYFSLFDRTQKHMCNSLFLGCFFFFCTIFFVAVFDSVYIVKNVDFEKWTHLIGDALLNVK